MLIQPSRSARNIIIAISQVCCPKCLNIKVKSFVEHWHGAIWRVQPLGRWMSKWRDLWNPRAGQRLNAGLGTDQAPQSSSDWSAFLFRQINLKHLWREFLCSYTLDELIIAVSLHARKKLRGKKVCYLHMQYCICYCIQFCVNKLMMKQKHNNYVKILILSQKYKFLLKYSILIGLRTNFLNSKGFCRTHQSHTTGSLQKPCNVNPCDLQPCVVVLSCRYR